MTRAIAMFGMMLALAACGGGETEPNLLNINQPRAEGPDEFAVLPTKPLEMPEDVASLPAPTPGGVNRTDVSTLSPRYQGPDGFDLSAVGVGASCDCGK